MWTEQLNHPALREDFEESRVDRSFRFKGAGFHKDLSLEYDFEAGLYENRWVIELYNSDGALFSVYDYKSKTEYDEDLMMFFSCE
jgi:hypothetical protein